MRLELITSSLQMLQMVQESAKDNEATDALRFNSPILEKGLLISFTLHILLVEETTFCLRSHHHGAYLVLQHCLSITKWWWVSRLVSVPGLWHICEEEWVDMITWLPEPIAHCWQQPYSWQLPVVRVADREQRERKILIWWVEKK